MTVLQVVALAAVAVTGTATALVHDPHRQVIVGGFFGLALAVLFFVFQAPDVALSQIVVSSVVLPALALLTLARLAREEDDE
jgi:energy-converting hydrogenase B subunit D